MSLSIKKTSGMIVTQDSKFSINKCCKKKKIGDDDDNENADGVDNDAGPIT